MSDSLTQSQAARRPRDAGQIHGSNFRDPVKVELLDRTGTVVKTIASIKPTSATQIDATLPTSGMAQDAYLVRVIDLDETTCSAFIVGATGASGNLHVLPRRRCWSPADACSAGSARATISATPSSTRSAATRV